MHPEFKEQLFKDAKQLRIFTNHHYTDAEFMVTLAYRTEQEIARCEMRLESLKQFQGRFTA